jgi:hypothetical protein
MCCTVGARNAQYAAETLFTERFYARSLTGHVTCFTTDVTVLCTTYICAYYVRPVFFQLSTVDCLPLLWVMPCLHLPTVWIIRQ